LYLAWIFSSHARVSAALKLAASLKKLLKIFSKIQPIKILKGQNLIFQL
jgi:hypothetical protein